MLVNREKLSDLLGCSLRTIDEYKRQGMPGDAPKRPGDQWRFDSATVVEWLRDRERADALGEVAKVTEDEAKRRKLAAEASLAEFDLALKQGTAVSVLDFEHAWNSMLGAARSKLLGIGSALGPELSITTDPAECGEKIDFAVKEALAELSEYQPDLSIDPAGTGEPESETPKDLEPMGAPARSDGKRVGGRRAAAQPGVKR